ncbi:UDP-N-acetylmuramoyl-L-alanyl-D-glutamate--2,6-diaminopimelate ligase [Exiguobacterium undae]|jgi:UDP-N-acetylmuramoyl-L-alanyl-D-glutamate--2,6-diaminopimelate ligase|uniref:UDP-N-acetylmuramyl-tripeptide synthetase n=1 Tax=Exiguobacterium undae TaxID=169177 RepID=A0ABX2V9B6_9BACL|nr:UDP-N-acetylmuramoyl-L-alanyl-D-glutamate--2,6-diaminopimelate ligase [Exiguobacterium undae]OAN14795.1 UDP-N-acetylmuramyl peptide synthase [Exiguobacterium undae]
MNRPYKHLSELIALFQLTCEEDPIVTSIETDSRQVTTGSLFICVRGYTVDGHQYAREATENGAVAILAEEPLEGMTVPVIVLPNTKQAAGRIADLFYDHPSRQLRVYGITGTNGKTTTTKLTYDLFRSAGHKAGMISTVGAMIDGEMIDTPNTTPEAVILHRLLHQMVEQGVTDCVLEVSSHALMEGRVEGVQFHAAAFTNLTHDHLDYHASMEEYAEAKALLFEQVATSGGKAVVLNEADPTSALMAKAANGVPVLWYATEEASDAPIAVEWQEETVRVRLDGTVTEVPVFLLGDFNAANLAAAIGLMRAGEVNMYQLIRHIPELRLPKGRLERVPFDGCEIYIDYAHTPDGLEKCLKALSVPNEPLYMVLSAAGERDRSKRQEMGRIASQYCEGIIVTVHDPRRENPQQIIKELIAEIAPRKIITCHETRKEALQIAAKIALTGKRIVIVGKGHERFERIGMNDVPFDEMKILTEELSRLSGQESAM